MGNNDTTERAIRRRQIAAGPARAVVLRRHFDAATADVWAACTEADRLDRWYHQMTGDLRSGGTFQ